MFFRRQKPRSLTFSDRLDALRAAGFTVEGSTSPVRVVRGRCAAAIDDGGDGPPVVREFGLMVGNEIGQLVSGGYQSFIETPSGKKLPALARDLTELHAFEEDFRAAAGLESLYNESLGTTFGMHLYDRVANRDSGQIKPWQR